MRRRTAGMVIAGALVAALAASPLAPADPVGASADSEPPWAHGGWRRVDADAAVSKLRRQSTTQGGDSELRRHAEFFEADYSDVCDDASGSRIDLRLAGFVEDSAGDRIIGVSSCHPWSAADLGVDGSFTWVISVPGGRSDGPDYVALMFRDDSGALAFGVLHTPSDDPATWVATHADSVEQSPDGHAAVSTLPREALGSSTEFGFGLGSADASGREDFLPEPHEFLLLYPYSCQTIEFDRATVTAEPGRFDDAVAGAAALGLEVTSQARAIGVFEVRGTSRLGRAVRGRPLSAIAALASVAAVRRPAAMQTFEVLPNDPGYASQWALPAVAAPAAWDTTTGSQLTLAVIDDGVDATRADFAGRVLAGRDAVFGIDLPAGSNSDRGGHGTAVAGVAAAAGNDGTELAGVDWSARILPIRVTDGAGCITDAAVAAAITYAADRGASVINISMGTTEPHPTLAEAIDYAFAKGSLIVASAGNDVAGNEPVYPAAHPKVVSVGATTRAGDVAPYSNRNATIDLTAPGGDGSGTEDGDVAVLVDGDQIGVAAGTSFAAPHVAGAALLYRSVWPGAAPGAVFQAMRLTAADLGSAGRDDAFGHGLLDISAAITVDPATAVVTSRAIGDACPPGTVPSAGFTDVSGNAHGYAIDCAVWWSIASGTTSTTWSPSRDVTRAQMATFIARLVERAGGSLPSSASDHFGDDDGNVHETSINRLAEAGLVSGVGSGRYAPHSPVSRAQMATFLVRAHEYLAGPLPQPSRDWFVDDDESAHEANVDKAAEAGFTGGAAPAVYEPTLRVRRDQMASFLVRVLDLLVESGVTPARAQT